MDKCTIYDCEFDQHSPGVIIDSKVYALDEENKPTDVSSLAWGPWETMLSLMQFYIGNYNELYPEDSQSKWGFFNLLTGEIVVPPIYEHVYPFYGTKLAKVILNKKTGFIDTRGRGIGGIVWDEAHTFNIAAMCAVRKGALWGYIGRDGELVFEPQFDEVGEWKVLFEIAPYSKPSRDEVLRQACSKKEYAAWVKKDGKYGYIDDQGNYFVEPLFDDARDFWAYHYAPVKVYEKWGFIDRTGKFAIPPIFSDIGKELYSFYVVNQEGTWGILSPELKNFMPEEGVRYVVYNGEKVYLKNGQVTSRRKIKE
ncbi:MAG: hypothetical protein H6Q69_142 [Firmicutes bacterium]|nr:hypothetical protein [Bacillota bacterium]MBP2657110.1 hypothetical protein [Bacillota bacterium]